MANLLVLRSSFCTPAVLCLLRYRSALPVSAVAGIEIFNFPVCNIPGCIAVRHVHYVTISTLLFQETLFHRHKVEKNREHIRQAIKSNFLNNTFYFMTDTFNIREILKNCDESWLVTLLHVDKAHILEVIQVNPGVSGSFTRKRRAESSHRAADIVDATTKDVILPNPSKLHNSHARANFDVNLLLLVYSYQWTCFNDFAMQITLLTFNFIGENPLIFMKLEIRWINFNFFFL